MAADACEFDAFIEGGVRRNAIEVKNLESGETQRDGDGLSETLVRPLQERLDARIEGDLPAERTEHECGCEVAVFRGEFCSVRRVQEVVAIALPCRDEHEDVERCETRGRHGL